MPVSAILPGGPIADEPADVVIAGREVLARGFRPYERVQARRADGAVETRDLLRAGAAVAVFPIDLHRDEGGLVPPVLPAAPPAHGQSARAGAMWTSIPTGSYPVAPAKAGIHAHRLWNMGPRLRV